jgi:hypothetical protein
MTTERCKAQDDQGNQCGDYLGHRGAHTVVPASRWITALIAERRLKDAEAALVAAKEATT